MAQGEIHTNQNVNLCSEEEIGKYYLIKSVIVRRRRSRKIERAGWGHTIARACTQVQQGKLTRWMRNTSSAKEAEHANACEVLW